MTQDLRVTDINYCGLPRHDEKPLIGIERLGQRFMIELLTESNSIKYQPARGCSFLQRIKKIALTEYDVVGAFAVATIQIKKHLRSEETARTLPNERFKAVRLNSMVLENNTISIEFTITNKANEGMFFVTPTIRLND